MRKIFRLAAAAALGLSCSSLFAQQADTAAASDDDQGLSPGEMAWANADAARQPGPQDIKLLDEATLHLPAGYAWIPHDPAVAAMQAMGNSVGDEFLGLVVPTSEEQWIATVDFIKEGYIKDDDAAKWDVDELMDNLREGTKEGNKFREQQGVTPIEVSGWIQKPAYDKTTHQLVWSVGIKDEGAASQPDDGVNYNTYVLGRDGYFSLDFLSSQDQIEAQKPEAAAVLSAVDYTPGHRYGDFNSSTDKVAAYGLAALVGGVALKKVGLFAVLAAFLVKGFKLILVALVAGGAAVRKFFNRSKA